MEAFIGGVVGGLVTISYMLFRVNRELAADANTFRKDARAAQAQVLKLESKLEQQKIIASSSKITPFPTKTSDTPKQKHTQLIAENDLLKKEQKLVVEALDKVRFEVNKPENMSSSMAMKIRAYLTAVVGIAS